MLKEFHFIDNRDSTDTKVLASSFDFAYLIFCMSFGFYEVVSCVEISPSKYHIEVTD